MFALEGCGLLVNAASYRVNLRAMDACSAAGCSYVDLGGLYHLTGDQLGRSEEFAERGLLAILGVGAGPGKTNVMAARAAAELDQVEVVRCASAGLDADPPEGLSTPYAIQTLMDELTVPPVVVRDGTPTELDPMTDGGGPLSRSGGRARLAVHPALGGADLAVEPGSERVRLPPLARPGGARGAARSARHLARGDRPAAPGSALVADLLRPARGGARGPRGCPPTVTVTALTVPHERWGLGGGIVSTRLGRHGGRPPLRSGAHPQGRGAPPPESCLPFEKLAAELEPRGATFQTRSPKREVPAR